MTVEQIEEKQTRGTVKFEMAKKLRELLDAAKAAYGEDAWDEDEVDAAIQEMVFEDE